MYIKSIDSENESNNETTTNTYEDNVNHVEKDLINIGFDIQPSNGDKYIHIVVLHYYAMTNNFRQKANNIKRL